MQKLMLPFAVGVAGLLAAGGAVAGKPLFADHAGKADPRNERALETLLSNPSTRGVRIVDVDASASDGDAIEVMLGNRPFELQRDHTRFTDRGSQVWVGHVAGARGGPLNEAVLVNRDDRITGNIRIDGQLYRIRPLPDGSTAVIEVDESRMPADHEVEPYEQLLSRADRQHTATAGTTETASALAGSQTIRVMVVATDEAVSSYGGDMEALIELAVAETNQGYANSNVDISLELASYSTTSYSESGSFSTDLARFRGTGDGYMDDIHALRDASNADVGMIVLDNSGSCGLASGIGSNASTAFASVYWDCATGYYSFGHEIGHLQSARHDPANDRSTTPYAYGHGYQDPDRKWRTIMAYNCRGKGCPRLNYWSNPAVNYNGTPMGTTSSSHNQRVLEETKVSVGGFR